ncbi:MAG: UTP--glucose-1-phosphate uridylyltransferase [Verrucomicrobiota bacterium]
MSDDPDPRQFSSNPAEQNIIRQLLENDQTHLFSQWDEPGTENSRKAGLLASLGRINDSYPGGLHGYITNARKLLADAKAGTNPFAGFTPHQPEQIDLTRFNADYDQYESIGMTHFDRTAIVLVAGGLGERLGYSGIKLDIPVEVTENTSYLAHYASCLKAMEDRMEDPHPVPFIVMTSEDTNAKTLASLESNRYFGLHPEQVHILKQELVPAISDNDGKLALNAHDELILKPHGHGDIHMLLHSSGIASQLAQQGIQHLIFIQDTNGQVFNAVPAALGASVEHDYDFNSIAVNRIPGEACGALAKLVSDEREMTINVEYNQLDPLLRATVSPEGDVPNEQGNSIFPGNINVLLIKLSSYLEILERTQGIIAEFVNPKYADQTRTTFRKPTRLETMMQDLAKLYDSKHRIGVSVFDRSWAFSANKNNVSDAAAKHAAGGPPESAVTAESDFYQAGRRRLSAAGVTVEASSEEKMLEIPLTPGPRVLLRPSFAMTLAEVRSKIMAGSIHGTGTLILDGPGIRLENVSIADGAGLVIKAGPDARVTVKDLQVENDGFVIVPLTEDELKHPDTPEYLRIRGYRIQNKGAKIYEFSETGEYQIDASGQVVS